MKIITTRLTGGLISSYNPLLPASALIRWLSHFFSSLIALDSCYIVFYEDDDLLITGKVPNDKLYLVQMEKSYVERK